MVFQIKAKMNKLGGCDSTLINIENVNVVEVKV